MHSSSSALWGAQRPVVDTWNRRPDGPAPAIPPYDPVRPTGGGWGMTPMPDTTHRAIPTPPGVLDGPSEPPTGMALRMGAGLGAAPKLEPEPEPEPELDVRDLIMRDAVGRVLKAIDSFEQDVILLNELQAGAGVGSYGEQLEQLQMVGDVLRDGHNYNCDHTYLASLQRVVDTCRRAAHNIVVEVEDRSRTQPDQIAAGSVAEGRSRMQTDESAAFTANVSDRLEIGIADPAEGILVHDGDRVPLTVDALRDFLKLSNSGDRRFCRLCRNKKERKFELYIETAEDGTLRNRGVKKSAKTLIMSSKKRGKTDSLKANYPIKMELAAEGDNVMSSASENHGATTFPEALFLGKVRTLQRGKTYSLFDAGKNAHGSSTQHSKRLSAIKKEDSSQLPSTEVAAAEFEEDRAELATVRGTREAGKLGLEVLIATGDGTVFRPPSKSARKQQRKNLQDSSITAHRDRSNTTVVNGSTFVDGSKSVRADRSKFKPPPVHKSVLHNLWPDLPTSSATGSAESSSAAVGTMFLQSVAPELTARWHSPEIDDGFQPDDIKRSARNLVLKHSGSGDPCLQLAKIGEDEWLLDFWAPVTPLQAFGIAIVAFEHTSIRH